jgi:hypothetical protein
VSQRYSALRPYFLRSFIARRAICVASRSRSIVAIFSGQAAARARLGNAAFAAKACSRRSGFVCVVIACRPTEYFLAALFKSRDPMSRKTIAPRDADPNGIDSIVSNVGWR